MSGRPQAARPSSSAALPASASAEQITRWIRSSRLVFIAVWAIIIGVMQIWGAIQLRKEIEGEWLLILSGLLSVAFGVLLLVQPGAGALAVVWIIGWYAILAGCIYIALAFRLRKLKHPA